MSSTTPVNAAPTTITLGVNDLSSRELPFETAPRGIHIPMVYSWAEWGPTDAQLVYGNTISKMYGDATLDTLGKFATPTTPYLVNCFYGNANSVLFKRLLPDDIGPKSTLRIYADVVADTVNVYERNSDGSIKYDENDEPVISSTADGYRVVFTEEVIDTDASVESNYGKGTQQTGQMTSVKDGSASTKYPLFDFQAPHFGSKGNLYGLRLWCPTLNDDNPMNESLLTNDGTYPYRMALVSRSSVNASSRIVTDNDGENYYDVTLEEGQTDSTYFARRYLGEVAVNLWSDTNPPEGEPIKYGPIGKVYVYNDNVKELLTEFMTLEKASDYTGNDLADYDETTDFLRFNLLGLTYSDGAPYQYIHFDEDITGIRFTESTDHFLLGGSDGTMSFDALSEQVSAELDEWANSDSEYMDIIQYPCSAFWDTGFSLEVKMKLGKFISQRKNTMVFGSTYIDGEEPLTIAEDSSRGVAIIEQMRVYAESDYFATKTFRGMVFLRSGIPLSGTYQKRLSTNYEFANMVSRLAGGTSFRSQYLFDRVPNNTFSLLGSINGLWAPASTRNKDWANGLCWPERVTRQQVYFPAAHTVYPDDTSVLTSALTALIICECQTVGMYCQKYFSGGNYSKAVLKEKIETYCQNHLQKRFANLVTIDPECYFTDADNARGYSWTLVIRVAAGMMYTVETLYIESYREDDYTPSDTAFVS